MSISSVTKVTLPSQLPKFAPPGCRLLKDIFRDHSVGLRLSSNGGMRVCVLRGIAQVAVELLFPNHQLQTVKKGMHSPAANVWDNPSVTWRSFCPVCLGTAQIGGWRRIETIRADQPVAVKQAIRVVGVLAGVRKNAREVAPRPIASAAGFVIGDGQLVRIVGAKIRRVVVVAPSSK